MLIFGAVIFGAGLLGLRLEVAVGGLVLAFLFTVPEVLDGGFFREVVDFLLVDGRVLVAFFLVDGRVLVGFFVAGRFFRVVAPEDLDWRVGVFLVVAFFVVEYPEQGHCFWSLVGLAPGLQGQGLGKRVWRTMLGWHKKNGIDTISTSISSHNSTVLNLYISLGFRFPAPHMTFHWRPSDSQPPG